MPTSAGDSIPDRQRIAIRIDIVRKHIEIREARCRSRQQVVLSDWRIGRRGDLNRDRAVTASFAESATRTVKVSLPKASRFGR